MDLRIFSDMIKIFLNGVHINPQTKPEEKIVKRTCIHNKNLCVECMYRTCEHEKNKYSCRQCNRCKCLPGGIKCNDKKCINKHNCIHGTKVYYCCNCLEYCSHDKPRHKCKLCNKNHLIIAPKEDSEMQYLCKHKRNKYTCGDCGSGYCKHRRNKHNCGKCIKEHEEEGKSTHNSFKGIKRLRE